MDSKCEPNWNSIEFLNFHTLFLFFSSQVMGFSYKWLTEERGSSRQETQEMFISAEKSPTVDQECQETVVSRYVSIWPYYKLSTLYEFQLSQRLLGSVFYNFSLPSVFQWHTYSPPPDVWSLIARVKKKHVIGITVEVFQGKKKNCYGRSEVCLAEVLTDTPTLVGPRSQPAAQFDTNNGTNVKLTLKPGGTL